jgi:hypothetical protein
VDVVLNGVGNNSNVEAQVDPTFGALRASIRPLEFAPQGGPVGGHYYVTAVTGTLAVSLAAGSPLFSMRWTDTRMVMVLQSLQVAGGQLAAVTAGNPVGLEAIVARNFTTDYTGGSSNVVPAAGSQRARSSVMATSLFAANGGIRVATTAAMSSGVNTLDTAGFGATFIQAGAASSGFGPNDLYRYRDPAQHPVVLAANEGIVVRSNATNAWPAGATWQLYFIAAWAEVPAFDRN